MAWALLFGQVVLIGILLVGIKSFGKWTKQMLHTSRSNELLLKELKLLDRRVFADAASHAATFVQIDDEEKTA